ncbi:PGF-pre-PGF domain-containing protein [Candidatus Woesearchaeota archaeon]|nr:PGF-pre-PGF domain-containing protein [Candidatus Woesearchaeota archaeon]
MKLKTRRLKRQNLFSLFLTLSIIFMLLLSGPVSGIQVGVTNISDTTPNESSAVTFQVYVDLTYQGENVPIENMTVALTNIGGLTNYTCTFNTAGTNLSACSGLTITKLNQVNYGYGYMWGYGYGYIYSTGQTVSGNTSFGYGYGYGYLEGYGYDNSNGSELFYNVSWTTPSVSSNTNYTVSFTAETTNAVVQYLNSTAATLQVQDVADSTSPSGGSGGSGGGGTTTDEVTEYKESKAWNKVTVGTETTMTIVDEKIGVRKILFTLNRDVSDVTMDVIAYSDRPTKIPAFAGGTIFQYLEIVTNLVEGDVSSATIDFRVTKAWLSLNNIGYDDVALYRYKGDWTELPTTKASDDATYVYYSATSPGFSYFAIGQKVVAVPPTETEPETGPETGPEEQPETETGPTTEPETGPEGEKESRSLAWLWWMIVIVLVVAGGAYYYFTYYRPKSKA